MEKRKIIYYLNPISVIEGMLEFSLNIVFSFSYIHVKFHQDER